MALTIRRFRCPTFALALGGAGCLVAAGFAGCASPVQENTDVSSSEYRARPPPRSADDARVLGIYDEGRETFRHDTFGDEDYWGGTLRIHEAIVGSHAGGVGAGVSPRAALALGLKVDVDALPPAIVNGLKRGTVDLDDPAVTVALLKLQAVVGIKGFFSGATSSLTSVGIQCALCHSSVDDSLAPGIGHRLDGWAARDLDVGKVIELSPDLHSVASLLGVPESTVRTVLRSWGKGRFDATLLLDGKAFRPDGATAAVLIPPAFGLAGVNAHTWTGWGGISHWNALVATVEMHGQGTFIDPRLDDATQFPVAAAAGFGHVRSTSDRVTRKLGALQIYQLALNVPAPPCGSFSPSRANDGEQLFNGKAKCATCHVPPLFTEPGYNLHAGAEIGIDEFQSSRGPERKYRTSPLRGLFSHAQGGYYHDGRFATLDDVVEHYDSHAALGLTATEKQDLVHYLKSL